MQAIIEHGYHNRLSRCGSGDKDVVNVDARAASGSGGRVASALPAELCIRAELSASEVIVEELEAVIHRRCGSRGRRGASVHISGRAQHEGGAIGDGTDRGVRSEGGADHRIAGACRGGIRAHRELRGAVDREDARVIRDAATALQEHACGKGARAGHGNSGRAAVDAAREVGVRSEQAASCGESRGAGASDCAAASSGASAIGYDIGQVRGLAGPVLTETSVPGAATIGRDLKRPLAVVRGSEVARLNPELDVARRAGRVDRIGRREHRVG